jgi:hypothetical protein
MSLFLRFSLTEMTENLAVDLLHSKKIWVFESKGNHPPAPLVEDLQQSPTFARNPPGFG